MKTAASLIKTFKKCKEEAWSKKISILQELEYLSDSESIPFMIETALNKTEYDLVRIEALKIIGVKKMKSKRLHNTAAAALNSILRDEYDDDDVRNYAAMATGHYLETDGVFEALIIILYDETADTNMRWSAFAEIERAWELAPKICASVMRHMMNDSEFRESAVRVLNEWETPSGT
jgi:hypothetical protein